MFRCKIFLTAETYIFQYAKPCNIWPALRGQIMAKFWLKAPAPQGPQLIISEQVIVNNKDLNDLDHLTNFLSLSHRGSAWNLVTAAHWFQRPRSELFENVDNVHMYIHKHARTHSRTTKSCLHYKAHKWAFRLGGELKSQMEVLCVSNSSVANCTLAH